MKVSVGKKIVLLAAIGLFCMIVLVGGVYREVVTIEHDFQAVSQIASIQRWQSDSDMMHDALRADVLGAEAAAKSGKRADVADSLKDAQKHIATFQKNFQSILENTTNTAILGKAQACNSTVSAYLKSAEEVIRDYKDLESGPPDQKVQNYKNLFHQLEDELGEFTAVIEREAQRISTESTKGVTKLLFGGGIVAFVLQFALAWWITRSITKPVRACVDTMNRLASGDLTAQVGFSRADEIGELAVAIDKCILDLRSMVGQVTQTSHKLVDSAKSLTETAHTQAAGAEETNVQAETVASAGEQLAANSKSMAKSAHEITLSANAVADSVEQMSASIHEVARNCTQESEIAHKADLQAQETKKLISTLKQSAVEIGKVVELINRIAEQTNLLALNASIEAAAAGEAGRGFAVVANEVKELARQSSVATEDIRRQVELIQGNTSVSVDAIDKVAHVIEEVSQIAASIAATVEEQSATTSEIVQSLHRVSNATETLSENVQHSSQGADEVSRNIHGVSTAASEAARSATHISDQATELNHMATGLSALVARFKV